MAINILTGGQDLDRVLKEVYDALSEENNGKIVCIRSGHLAFVDGEEYFTVNSDERSNNG